MRIAVLGDELREDARPDEADGQVQARLVAGCLARAGHAVSMLQAGSDPEALRKALGPAAPELVFNLVEGTERIHRVPALLEREKVAFTGSPSAALRATTHKTAAKRRLRSAGLPTPDWVEAGEAADAPRRRWIVKPVCEDASVGIDDGAVIDGSAAEALQARRRAHAGELFAEAYVEGREFNLSLLAAEDAVQVLPPAEIAFQDYPEGKPRIVGYAAKWDDDSFEAAHTPRRFDFDAAEAGLLAHLEELGRRCWTLFGLRGYARVDLRVDSRGDPWILEVNANPCLAPGAGFLAAAERAGLDAGGVVSRIVAAALAPGGGP